MTANTEPFLSEFVINKIAELERQLGEEGITAQLKESYQTLLQDPHITPPEHKYLTEEYSFLINTDSSPVAKLKY